VQLAKTVMLACYTVKNISQRRRRSLAESDKKRFLRQIRLVLSVELCSAWR